MDIKDVENLAELAKIDLNEDEKKQILKDMGGILEYVKTIESVKLDETKLTYDTYNVWREDKIEPQEFSKESIIKQFPDKQDNFLKVKKIL
ncbi:MAG: Asp-tRNA(Asn)/Glu-tRNA(Gln) amidotransferase subunit GatC [Candidatus Nomurabacteria bacterium]|nr:Asp-tRNA(Asn)/Glu-tRNA(Gln) amidotransferase subunit GatC [Candidatus Nomurabacteria bacterium]